MGYLGNSPQNQAFTPRVDYFSGNGSTTAFTLSFPVASVAQVQAVIENVPQNPGDAYTVSGNTITFTSAPPSGTNNIYVYYTSPITQVGALPQSPQIYGNLQFNSTAARIRGDFSNATIANRVMFQTSTTNGNTVIHALPNGTGTSSQFSTLNSSSDPANCSLTRIRTTSTDSLLEAERNGTGTYLPLSAIVGGSERLRIDTSGNVGIGTSSPISNGGYGGLSLNGTSGALFSLMTNGTESGRIASLGNETSVQCKASTGYITFVQGVSGGTERARIDSSGNLLINNSAAANGGFGSGFLRVYGANTGQIVAIQQSNGAAYNTITSWNNAASGTIYHIYFADGTSGSLRGSITTNGANTAYNTSSDYRLKENIAPMTGALAKVQALKPCTFTWVENQTEDEGFIAHELQEVIPRAVTGEKDAVDADGNPVYQGIDTSFLVATLTAAIQEQQEIINDLKARIETLEAK